jgi:hypothetical protein
MRARAISLRQPWASLIVYGLKTVEIRTWQTDYRGPLLIHASKTVDEDAMLRFKIQDPPKGCLIGTVELIDVEPITKPKWHEFAAEHLNIGPYTTGLPALVTRKSSANSPTFGRLLLIENDLASHVHDHSAALGLVEGQ